MSTAHDGAANDHVWKKTPETCFSQCRILIFDFYHFAGGKFDKEADDFNSADDGEPVLFRKYPNI